MGVRIITSIAGNFRIVNMIKKIAGNKITFLIGLSVAGYFLALTLFSINVPFAFHSCVRSLPPGISTFSNP